MKKIFVLISILIGLTSAAAWAEDVTLTWDASDDPNVAGYLIHYKSGTPDGEFDGVAAAEGPSPIDVGRSLTATISGLGSEVHYFAVTAYDNWGNESEFSNMIVNRWIPSGYFPGNSASLSPGKVDFIWEAPPVEAGVVSYKLIYSTDPTAIPGALAGMVHPQNALLAGMSFLGLAGLGMNSRRLRKFVPLIAACFFFLVSGCGGGGGSSSNSGDGGSQTGDARVQVVGDIQTNSHTVYDLQPSTTYYWQVVAIDTAGVEQESPVYTFTTEAL